jgi:hypothetical protein
MGFGTNNPRLKPSVKRNPQTAVQMQGGPKRYARDIAGQARKRPGSRPDLRGGRK